jgi:site-specific DNA-cytosine methylase
MGFAGSMAAGVDQAGFDVVAKREPSAFKGFGVESMTYNMPWVEAQVAPWGQWDLPVEKDIELVYGCPPCSGFSQLSSVNTKVYEHTGTTYRGADAEINECMEHLIDYAARIAPRIVIMESVGAAFKLGREWFEQLWQKLRDETGLDYKLAHVNMNAAWVGGDVIRPRYFMVAHLDPFGVGLDFVKPRPFLEVVSDLGPEDLDDTDWGHMTRGTRSTERITQTIEWLRKQDRDWEPGTRLPQNAADIGLEPPDFWLKEKPSKNKRGYREDVYSHWYSSDPFSPVRWRGDKPFGVIVAASLDRAIHPTEPRPLTFREAARFMSLPDTWSMRVLVEKNRPDELGKAVPTASAKWIAHWAKMSIEGTPGEYAGEDTDNPDIRVFNVQKAPQIEALWDNKVPGAAYHPESITSDPNPDIWMVDRKQRPPDWWQREDELGIFNAPIKQPRTVVQRSARASQTATKPKVAGTIARIPPTEVAALLETLGLTKQEAASKLGVSIARVNELTTNTRPGSWLNAERWDQVQVALRA